MNISRDAEYTPDKNQLPFIIKKKKKTLNKVHLQTGLQLTTVRIQEPSRDQKGYGCLTSLQHCSRKCSKHSTEEKTLTKHTNKEKSITVFICR